MLKKLFEKYSKETILYLVFGVATTGIDYMSAMLLYHMGMGEVAANTIAWVVAVAFAYITNKLFVFDSRQAQGKALVMEAVQFVGSRVITLIVVNVMIALLSKLKVYFLISKLISNVIVIILNYILSKCVVFN